jgi:hypothetical protein
MAIMNHKKIQKQFGLHNGFPHQDSNLMNILENVLKIPHSIVSALLGAHKFVVYLGVV